MDLKDLEVFLTDKNNYVSMMNRVDFLSFVTEDDYFLYQLTDKHEYRVDLISEEFLGNKNLYFFFIWLNSAETFVDTIYDEVIGIGNGVTRNYHFEMLNKPIYPESSSIFYVIGNQTYYMIDTKVNDESGTFSGADGSGTIDYINSQIDMVFNADKILDLDSEVKLNF